MVKSIVKTTNIQLFDKENPPEVPTLVSFYTDGEIALWCPDNNIFVVLHEGRCGYSLGYHISLSDSEEDIMIYKGDITLTEE